MVGDKAEAAPPLDGRHQRSERTRTAIVDALLALLDEGDLQPSTDRIADRAGVSRRNVFHHFHDQEDLLAAAADRQLQRVMPTLRPIGADGPLASRLAAYVAQLCGLYVRVASVRRAALLAERSSKALAARLRQGRAMHRASIEHVFAAELSALSPRDEALAAIVAATSFSTWEELVTHQGLSPAAAERAIRRTLSALVTATEPQD